MAVTDQQKIDFLLKKIGYTKTKTGSVDGTGSVSGTPKQPFAEAIASPLVVPNSSLWNEADSIPTTPPGSDTNQVKVYSTTSAIRMTADATSSGNRAYIAYSTYNDTSSARLTNWIDTQFGSLYLIKVFKNDPTVPSNNLSAGATNENWFFDYSAGVLNFNDTTVPTHNDIYIVGYRYIGQTGAPTSGISTFSYLDLTVERNLDVGVQGGISTFHNNIDLNADLDVDGHTELDNLKVVGVATFTGGGAKFENGLDTFDVRYITETNTKISFGSDIISLHGNVGINSTAPTSKLDIDGDVKISGVTTFSDDVEFHGNSGIASITFDKSDNRLKFATDSILSFGDSSSSHLEIRQTGDFAYIQKAGSSGWIDVSGDVKLNNDLDIVGDLDVDGHTNLDNVSIAGVSTFSDDIFIPDDKKIKFGNTSAIPDFEIFHSSDYNDLKSNNGNIRIRNYDTSGSGKHIYIQSENVQLRTHTNNHSMISAFAGAQVELYHNNVKRLETTNKGIQVGTGVTIETNGQATFVGIVTATSFSGSLTGNVTGDVSGNAGTATALQTARNIGGVSFDGTSDIDLPGVNIAGNQDTSGTAAGLSGSPSINITNLTAVDGTFSGNVSIGGTLTYEDVTNIDSVGLITARSGIFLPDNQKVQLGNAAGSADLEIYHSGNHSFIDDIGTGNLKIRSNNLRVSNGDESKLYATFTPTAVELYYNNIKRLETTGIGIAVNGKTDTQLLDVNGRANIFDMEVSGISTFAGNVDINVDLDVDGHTNLDNVSVAGVTTFASFVAMGNNSISFDHAGGSQSNQRIFNDGNDFRMRSTSTTGIRIEVNASGGNNSDIKLQTNTIDALVVKGTGEIEIAKDLDVDGHTNLDNVSVAGVTTFSGIIEGVAGENKIPSLYANMGALPSAGSYHGMFAHVHETGRGYFAHAGGWLELVNKETNGTVGTGTETYNLNNVSVGSSISVGTGVTIESNGQATFTGIVTASSFRGDGSQLTGISVDATSLKDSNGNVKIQANESGAVHVGIATFQDIDVDGHTELDNVNISGVVTATNFAITSGGQVNMGGNLTQANYPVQITTVNSNEKISFYRAQHDDLNDEGAGIAFSRKDTGVNLASGLFSHSNGGLGVAAIQDIVFLTGGAAIQSTDEALRITSTGNVNVKNDIDVDGHTNLDNLSVAGVSTFASNVSVGGSITATGLIQAAGGSSNGIKLGSSLHLTDAANTQITQQNNASIYINADNIELRNRAAGSYRQYIRCGSWASGAVGLFHDDGSNANERLRTTSSGINVTGNVVSDGLVVDGHTNLDNVSIAGVTTISNDLHIESTSPKIYLTDTNHNSDWYIGNSDGDIIFYDTTLTNTRFRIYKGNSPTLRPFIETPYTTDARFDGFVRIGGDVSSPNHSLTVGGNSNFSGISTFVDIDVDGHTNLDNVSVAGVTTFTGAAEFDSDARFDSTITAGGGTGNNGQYLKSTGSGVAWESFPTMRTTTTVTASAGQTTFSFTYNVGFLDVFINGTKLTDSEFTASNGSSVVLAVGCFVGDIVELVSYNTVSGGGGGGAGSITVQDEGSSLSTGAETLNFVGTGVVASGNGATKTITINAGAGDTSNVTTNNLDVVGFTTFQSSVLVQGSNTRLNIGDANSHLYMSGNVLRVDAYARDIQLQTNAGGGDSKDIILHGGPIGGELLRAHGTGDVDITNTLGIGGSITKASGHLDIRASNLSLKNANNSATYASFTDGGAAELNHNNTKRLETLSNGVNVIGSLFVNGSAIGGGGGGSGFFSQTTAGIHTLSNVGIGTADPEFDLDLGSYTSQNVSTASTIRIMGDGASSANTAIRFGAGGNNVDYTLLRVDGQDGTTDGDGNTDLGFALRYMSAGESGTDNRLAFWADNTTKTKYEALSIYNDGRVLVDNGASGGHGFHGHPPDHFTVRGSSKLDNVRVVGVSTVQHILPETDSTYDIGTNTLRVRNVYADNLYGDGTNITGISGGGGSNVGITTNLSGSFSATPGSPTTINTLSGYSSDDLVVEYTIYIKNGSNIQTQKLLAMRDGTTIDSTQFAVMFSSTLLAQFDATISSGNILLRATPESGITGTTDYKIKREVM